MNARTALPTADPVNSADIATSNLGTLRAERAIARSVTRRTWKGAVGIGVTFGVVAASSALSYVSSFPTEASRRTMAAGLSGASSFSILFGSVARIGSVGGYTAYKSFVFLTTIGAVWAILTTTRQLRGEEESGRWFLLISGRTQAVRATGATLAGIGVSLAVALALTTFITALAGARSTVGFSPWDSLVFAAASVMPAIVFAGVAAVASQLARTRRLANVIAMGCFAVLFVVRMLGDVGDSRPALLWATPMGWTELVEPLSQNSLRPFLAGATATALLVATALLLAAHRDSGDGIFATHETRPLRPLGLGSTLGLSARLTASLTLAWVIGILTTSFVFGVVTHSAVSALTSSESTSSTLTKLGAPGGGVPAFLGVIFILLGTILALVPAGLIGSARDEEASG
ncbi:MAG TPA: hypothetical protein VL068_04915, partial [Microthrixaceae bacterium]|nr:hypothetical protein [Microthrixaceae bacterium]